MLLKYKTICWWQTKWNSFVVGSVRNNYLLLLSQVVVLSNRYLKCENYFCLSRHIRFSKFIKQRNKCLSNNEICIFRCCFKFLICFAFCARFHEWFQLNSFLSRLNCILLAFQFKLAFLCLAVTAVTAEFKFMPF